MAAREAPRMKIDWAGKLQLRGRKEKLPVSRLYAHLFKAM
jgi:hypothetical protein